MNAFDGEQIIGRATGKHTNIYYRYALLVEKELKEQYHHASQALWECYEEGDLISNLAQIEAAQKAVDDLEKACLEVTARWDAERNTNPPVHHALQKQELTPQDLEFGTERREQLRLVKPESGHLFWFAETGTEGADWSFEVDGLEGYDALRILQQGDRLVIYDDDGSVLFDEILIEDHESGWHPFDWNYPYGTGQQSCGGLWVHWIPKGKSPQEWALLFVKLCKKRAELYQLSG